MSELVMRARIFCRAAHQAVGQKRKYTNEPYYHHPIVVADLVRSYGGTENMIAAALLHDILEDTQVPMFDLVQEFNIEVMTLVYELTEQFTDPIYGNRASRKRYEAARLATISPEAQTIKYADIIHNTQSIVANDPRFSKVYLPEIRNLLNVLTKGDSKLKLKAWATVIEGETLLAQHTPA